MIRTLTGALLGAAIAVPAHAAIVINITSSGATVLAETSGSLDTGGLSFVTDAIVGSGGIFAASAGYVSGDPSSADTSVYQGLTGPASFGPGSAFDSIGGTGDIFGINGILGLVFLPLGYVSGASVSNLTTFAGTIGSLGLTPGSYVYDAGNDTITLNIGGAVPEPAGWAMMTLGFGLLGAAMRRRGRQSFVTA